MQCIPLQLCCNLLPHCTGSIRARLHDAATQRHSDTAKSSRVQRLTARRDHGDKSHMQVDRNRRASAQLDRTIFDEIYAVLEGSR